MVFSTLFSEVFPDYAKTQEDFRSIRFGGHIGYRQRTPRFNLLVL